MRARHLPHLLVAVVIAIMTIRPGVETPAAALGHTAQVPGSPAGISGLWLVSPFPDRPSDRELALFTSDGSMFASESPSSQAAPGQAPPGVNRIFSSQGYGLWVSRADGAVGFTFLQNDYDPDGHYLDTISVKGTLSLDASISAFSGTYTVTVTLPDASSMEVQGETPVTGMRAGL